MGNGTKIALIIALIIAAIISIGAIRKLSNRVTSFGEDITIIVDKNGGRVDWSHTNDTIVHSRYGKDGYYDLWIMNPDGSNVRCLTCDNSKIPQLHNGQPAWHPSGDYIVFQSQDPSLPHSKLEDYTLTQPGHGKHNNLWITDPNGDNFYQLTNIGQNRALLHPHFSHDGSKLAWSEQVGENVLNWAIMIADFVETPEPHLENIKSYQPKGEVWYEVHGFSIDDSKILCTIGTEGYFGYDIWEMEITTQELTQLTNRPDIWDEHAHYSPNGKKIVWVSSDGYTYDPSSWWQTLKTDLWIMDADGSNKQRVTHFNEPGYPEYAKKRVIVSDSSWSPNGKRVVATLVYPDAGRSSAQIVIINVENYI